MVPSNQTPLIMLTIVELLHHARTNSFRHILTQTKKRREKSHSLALALTQGGQDKVQIAHDVIYIFEIPIDHMRQLWIQTSLLYLANTRVIQRRQLLHILSISLCNHSMTCPNLQTMNEMVVCCLAAFGSKSQVVPASSSQAPTYV